MFVHGDNLNQKENHTTKYIDPECKKLLTEIREKYNEWKQLNLNLIGPKSLIDSSDEEIIIQRVKLFSDYKDFIDQKKYAEKFDSRSNLHSSVLEEFAYFLFKDLVKDLSEHALIGKAHTVKDFFFMAGSFKDMIESPNIRTEKKDHDFVIGVNINASFSCRGGKSENEVFQVPAVAIECKTYLDKTMLEGASAAAHQLKNKNPNALYIVVSEWLKLTEDVNLNKFLVDQIYVLRKQKNTDREFRFLDGYNKKVISTDVVIHLFNTVRDHLTINWESSISQRLERGWLK